MFNRVLNAPLLGVRQLIVRCCFTRSFSLKIHIMSAERLVSGLPLSKTAISVAFLKKTLLLIFSWKYYDIVYNNLFQENLWLAIFGIRGNLFMTSKKRKEKFFVLPIPNIHKMNNRYYYCIKK